MDISRRDFLVSASVISASTILNNFPEGAAHAQNASGINPGRIDVHHHVLPPEYVKRERERILAITDADPAALFAWTPAQALAAMDQNGVATAIASIPLPGVWFGDSQEARGLARMFNEYAAGLVSDHPGRFGLFATIPLPDPDGSLREIEYAFGTLKADGIGLLTDYGDKWPGDSAFRPVFEELNRRKAVVFFHPTVPNCCRSLVPGVPSATTEFLFDTTRAIDSMIVNGTFARFPDIRFIFSHAGGTMPALSSRINAILGRHPEIAEKNPNGILYELKKLYYDVANSVNPSSMAALMNLAPKSQMLFGSDFPYFGINVTASSLDRFGLPAADLQAINHQNALSLFPHLKNTA